jgi:putative transposase
MNCPHCASAATKEQTKQTSLSYRTFRCSDCKRAFHKRTGTPFNFLEYPTDIVLLVVLWRLRYTLSLRESSRDVLATWLCVHAMCRSETGKPVWPRSWPINCVPSDVGKQADRGMSMRTLSPSKGNGATSLEPSIAMGICLIPCGAEKRNMKAARRFFPQAVAVVGHAPERVTTDWHDSYPRAIRETLGSEVRHRTNRYLNNRLEQDHRGIKQRYYSMRGFGSVASAARFCRACDEVRQFFRVRSTMKQYVSLAEQRERFRQRLDAFNAMVLMA